MAMSRLDSPVDPQYLDYRLDAHEYADHRVLFGLRSKTTLAHRPPDRNHTGANPESFCRLESKSAAGLNFITRSLFSPWL